MAEPVGAQVAEHELAGARRSTSSHWIDGRDGKLPWSHRKVVALIALPLMALLIGVATAWAVFHIQDTLEDESRRDLAAASIDSSGLAFDYDYRSGTARGVLPAGVTAAEAEAAVDHGLLRELTIVAEPAAAGDSAQPPAPARDPAAPPAAAAAEVGPSEATAQLAEGQIVLRGVVLSDVHRAALVRAASAAVGADNVRDELTVSGFGAAVGGVDERVSAMAEVLASLAGAQSATVVLTDASLDVTAMAADTGAAIVVEAAADGSPVPGAIAIDVAQGPTAVDLRLRRGGIVLRGSVLSEAQRAQLVDAAAALVGAGNVDDRLEVTGLAEATTGADERIAALASLIGELGDATVATGALSDTDLRLSATTRARASADSIVAAGSSISATDATVTASVRPPAVRAQVAGLQTELDGLAAEIRDTVIFATGDAELSGAAQDTLDKVIVAMDSFARPVVEVSGHTDDVGEADSNQALSADRAAAVVAYLVAGGIADARLRSRGAGEAEPLADNTTSEGRAQNRRVEFTARARFQQRR